MSAALQLTTSPEDYFREQLQNASTDLKVKLDPRVEIYITNLLCEFIYTQSLKQDGMDEPNFALLDQPMVLMLQKAMDAPSHKKLKMFRRIGDISLYVSGFFQDFFNRKAYDISYYVGIGANAYDQVASLSKASSESSNCSVYKSLSKNFENIVDVVALISDSKSNENDHDTLAIYDRWNRIKSERLRRILEKRGIHPIPSDVKTRQ